MNRQSAVKFATASRVHVALAVRDVDKSVKFYSTLFGQPPTKTRPGYAKFEVAEPPVHLALNAVAGATGPTDAVSHFGVQVKSADAVREIAARLEAAGLPTRPEENVTCCYAVQEKVWGADPDGHRWEVFVVLDDAGTSYAQVPNAACCPQMGSAMAAVRRGDFETAASEYDQATGGTACCPPDCCTSPAGAADTAAEKGCCTSAAV